MPSTAHADHQSNTNLDEQSFIIPYEREACAEKLSYFVKQAWHVIEPAQDYVHGWHIDAVCDHLEAVFRGQINRLLINIPTGMMKSLLVSVFFPAWEWIHFPSTRYVTASHSQDFAVRDNVRMRRLVESDWFQQRWAIPFVKDQNEKTKFENKMTGFRQAMAMNSMTGSRGDRVILDDPHSIEGALSQADCKKTIRMFTETVPTRLNNPDTSAIIVVMQRITESDISGHIISHDLGYEHLMLPMEYEPERKCKTMIFTDPRTKEGELLFPERFPKEVVERDKKVMGSYAVAGQFQQRPTPRGGGIIKGEWFGRYKTLPPLKIKKIFGDTAMKTGEQNDFSVFECFGVHEGKLYMIDMVRGKWEAPELKRRTTDFWNKHKALREQGALIGMYVEDKASGTGLIQDIKREGRIKVTAVQRNKDKYTRIMEVVSYIEAGCVMIPENAEWAGDFIAECEQFTADDSHKFDDQIDPLIDAINIMLAKRGKNTFF